MVAAFMGLHDILVVVLTHRLGAQCFGGALASPRDFSFQPVRGSSYYARDVWLTMPFHMERPGWSCPRARLAAWAGAER